MPVQSKPVQKMTPFGAALAGALGACFSTAVVYPLDVAKTRIQASPSSSRNKNLSMVSVLKQVLQEEGISGWFRGFGATMLNTFSQQYAYFFFYSFVRNAYISRITRKLPPGSKVPALSTVAELLLGAIAGALAQIFTIPVSVIATRQQVGRSLDDPSSTGSSKSQNRSEDDNDSFWSIAKEIVEEEGVAGLWLGIKPGLVLTVNPAITYGVFERVKNVLLRERGLGENDKLSPLFSFLIGAFSKTLATVVTYPYIMAKVRIQARSADIEDALEEGRAPPEKYKSHHDAQHKHSGALHILYRVWKQEGFVGWYQGMSAQIIKAVLSQALLFVSKDQFEIYALVIMAFFVRRIRHRY